MELSEASSADGEALARRRKAESLIRLDRHEMAVEEAAKATELASEDGERAEAFRIKAISLDQLGFHEEAWESNLASLEMAREPPDWFTLTRVFIALVEAAVWTRRSEIIEVFGEWMSYFDRGLIPLDELGPDSCVASFFVGCARADRLDDFDTLDFARRLGDSSSAQPIYFMGRHGAALARMAAETDRASGYETMSALLPRIARFVEELPAARRDATWLLDIMSGFATACRDPGLLRDVAGLLTTDLDPEGSQLASLLRTVADFDESEDGQAFLARVDPDRATLVRRLRDLPAPESESPTSPAPRRKR